MATTSEVIAKLNYLKFVIQMFQKLGFIWKIYDSGKKYIGPLKWMVEKVEINFFTPIFDWFRDLFFSHLLFFDPKVGQASRMFDKHAPLLVKKVAEKALQKAKNLVNAARTGGVKGAFNYVSAESKNLLVDNSVKAWFKLTPYNPIGTVTDTALAWAKNVSEKYNNDIVKGMPKKGFSIFGYLPLVPVEDIVRAYQKEDAEAKKRDADAKTSSSASS